MKLIKSLLIAAGLTTFFTNVFADTCPTVDQLRQNQLNGWTVYSGGPDEGYHLATAKEAKEMEAQTNLIFSTAQWNPLFLKSGLSNAQCTYYVGGGPYLFKMEPQPLGSEWSNGHYRHTTIYFCYSDTPTSCPF